MKNETIKTYTELDPCKAPDGCPELEPWQAYVGMDNLPICTDVAKAGFPYHIKWSDENHWEHGVDGSHVGHHHAIDVRTEWAQEHFPEHCRIRNYQEPDAFEEFCESWALDSLQYASPKWFKEMMRQAYELGQANPKKVK